MEQSPVQWPSEAHNSISCPSEMRSPDHFNAQEIMGSLGEDFQHPLSSKDHSYFLAFNSLGSTEFNSTFNCSSMDLSSSFTNVIKAVGVRGAVPDASSISFLSFGDQESVHDPLQIWLGNESENLYSNGSTSNEKTLDFQRTERNSKVSRPTSQDHVIAERKRREKLSQQFIALSAIIPGLKKTDKASLLGDAIKYLKQLEEKVKTLEEQAAKKKSVESVVAFKKSHLFDSNHIADNDGSTSTGEAVQKIEASLEGKTVLMRIHCEKKKGMVVKVLSEIEKLHLNVINAGVVPFADSFLHITVTAEIEEGFSMTVKDLVKEINSALK